MDGTTKGLQRITLGSNQGRCVRGALAAKAPHTSRLAASGTPCVTWKHGSPSNGMTRSMTKGDKSVQGRIALRTDAHR